MKTNTQIKPAENKVADGVFLPRLFDETMALLVEARNYFFAKSSVDQKNLTNSAKIVYSTEMSRITLRLSSIMAWVLARRAVLSGEITEEQLREHFALQCREACDTQVPHMELILPKPVCDLLNRSYSLYQRVGRLDLAA